MIINGPNSNKINFLPLPGASKLRLESMSERSAAANVFWSLAERLNQSPSSAQVRTYAVFRSLHLKYKFFINHLYSVLNIVEK